MTAVPKAIVARHINAAGLQERADVAELNAGLQKDLASKGLVFNQPRTEFVARFMGGHNVLTTIGGKIAVRTDRVTASRNLTGALSRAIVTEVEYQGAWVQANLRATDGTELVAMLPEAGFDHDPFSIGDDVGVHWDPQAAHPLA